MIPAGIGLLAIGGTQFLVDANSTQEFDTFIIRIGVVGYLLLAFGVASYFALEVFNRVPNP